MGVVLLAGIICAVAFGARMVSDQDARRDVLWILYNVTYIAYYGGFALLLALVTLGLFLGIFVPEIFFRF